MSTTPWSRSSLGSRPGACACNPASCTALTRGCGDPCSRRSWCAHGCHTPHREAPPPSPRRAERAASPLRRAPPRSWRWARGWLIPPRNPRTTTRPRSPRRRRPIRRGRPPHPRPPHQPRRRWLPTRRRRAADGTALVVRGARQWHRRLGTAHRVGAVGSLALDEGAASARQAGVDARPPPLPRWRGHDLHGPPHRIDLPRLVRALRASRDPGAVRGHRGSPPRSRSACSRCTSS